MVQVRLFVPQNALGASVIDIMFGTPARVQPPGAVTHTEHLDPVQVRRAYKFLMRPTSRQSALLAECLEDMRQLYNAAIKAGDPRHAI